MAQPSSSHHGEREHRHRSSSSHHHRTISSTTMLLVLSLILAVLAVMLSLPSSTSPESGSGGVMGFFNPKRSQALIARESAVAVREAEVARREAELLAGAPGGVVPAPTPVLCPSCTAATITMTEIPPLQTIIKEIVKEDSLAPPGWAGPRGEELLDRELKIAERERDISKREEGVNRREHDAARRESWIMEQLIALGNDAPQSVEDDYLYDTPKRKPPKYHELPPIFVSEVAYEQTKTVFETVTVPTPAPTRRAAFPSPEPANPLTTGLSPRTTSVEIVTEEADDRRPRTILRGPPKRNPARWFGNW